MSVTLETVATEESPEVQEQESREQSQEPIPEPQEPIPEQVQEREQVQEPEQPAQIPQPKRRGRPKKQEEPKAPKKAVRMSKPSVSSSDEEPINRDDMETMLMNYLLQRKHAQQNARRTMWAQMAGLS